MSMPHRDDLAWCEVGDALIFLDIAGDRYFRLPSVRERAFCAELDDAVFGRCHQPPSFPRAPGWKEPVSQSPAMDDGAFRLSHIARVMWVQRRIERRLASRTFHSVLTDLCRIKAGRGASGASSSADQIIRAFEQSRLLRSAADRCLPRSIALCSCLAVLDVPTSFVIGVKLAPFGAHSWVQSGAEVLNESVEEVLRYTPILIL